MSQATHRVIEVGNNPDGHPDRPQLTPNPPSQGESNFGDSSGPFFSLYSKIAEEEDKKMVYHWQKDADGIVIFAGLFSAAVAALLAVTVQDLRPNSQDTSAFYLGNIYGVLADPNVTRPSIPSPAAKPPPFSPPRYAVWVNSLWFLSLVMSLSCALWATSLQQWARRYIRLTQPARCSPEKRARMRTFFANGVDKMGIPWAVEGLPTLLHFSLFLFFGGLVIFLFNVNQEVFTRVVWWIGLFSIVYGLITLLPLIRHDSPYNTPLSTPAWFLYTRIPYVAFKVLSFIIAVIIYSICAFIPFSASIIFKVLPFITSDQNKRYVDHIAGYLYGIWEYLESIYDIWQPRSVRWLLGSVEKAEETASEQSSEIDVRILGWTTHALGDDDSLEKFFETIPGLFNSKLVNLERDFPLTDLKTFWDALDGLMGHTLSSNSVTDTVKSRRVTICRDIINMMPSPIDYWKNLRSHFKQAPVTMERLQAISRWFAHEDYSIADRARVEAAKSLASIMMQEPDDVWIAFASDMCGLAAQDLRNNIAHGRDNVFLATLIHVSRRAIHSKELDLVLALNDFDIRHTLPGLQHDFCTLWNELVQEAKKQGSPATPVYILRRIRRFYIALHDQGTYTAPAAFSASAEDYEILWQRSTYPLCSIASHRPNSVTQTTDSSDDSSHRSASAGNTVLQQVKQANVIPGPSSPFDPTTPSEITDGYQVPAATSPALPIHTSPHPTDASLPAAVAAAPQDIPPAASLSRPREGTMLQDIVTSRAEPDTSEILSPTSTLAPTPTLALVPESIPPVLNESLTSNHADAVPASNPFLPVSSVAGFSVSVPTSPPPSRVLPLPNAEFLALLNGTTPSRPTGKAALPRLRVRGLVNTGGMCFANALLQLLVHSPPFWDLFRKLGDLKGQHGGGPEPGGCATPLVDAMIIFFEEFVSKEKPPPTQQPLQPAAKGKSREADEKQHKITDSFEPTYLYEAMKEKRQLKHLLDGKHEGAEEFLGLYLDALDEELVELQTYISTHQATSVPSVEDFEGEAKSAEGQTESERRNYTGSPVESPISRIFGGRSRSTARVPSRPDTVTTEAWQSLKLHTQPDSVHTIQDALAHISQPQPVQVSQSSSSDASQEVLLEALPPVLVLHLERFMYDAATDGIVKISKPVQFAPELEIPLEIMAPVAGKSAEPVHYKLYGVLYHHGESAGSGHYTVDVLHPNGDSGSGEGWLHIDDEDVNAVRREDVFEGHDNERMDNQRAYMLFYCRTAAAWT